MPKKKIPSIGAIMMKKIPAVPDIQPNNILRGPQLIMSVTNQLIKKINVFHFLTLEHSDQVLNNIENVIYTTEVNYFLFYLNAATANRVVCAM